MNVYIAHFAQGRTYCKVVCVLTIYLTSQAGCHQFSVHISKGNHLFAVWIYANGFGNLIGGQVVVFNPAF